MELVYVCMYTCVCICIYVICLYVHVCVCVSVYLYVYYIMFTCFWPCPPPHIMALHTSLSLNQKFWKSNVNPVFVPPFWNRSHRYASSLGSPPVIMQPPLYQYASNIKARLPFLLEKIFVQTKNGIALSYAKQSLPFVLFVYFKYDLSLLPSFEKKMQCLLSWSFEKVAF